MYIYLIVYSATCYNYVDIDVMVLFCICSLCVSQQDLELSFLNSQLVSSSNG